MRSLIIIVCLYALTFVNCAGEDNNIKKVLRGDNLVVEFSYGLKKKKLDKAEVAKLIDIFAMAKPDSKPLTWDSAGTLTIQNVKNEKKNVYLYYISDKERGYKYKNKYWRGIPATAWNKILNPKILRDNPPSCQSSPAKKQ